MAAGVVQGLEPEIRTYNTAIIACNMCGQPDDALKVGQGWDRCGVCSLW